MTRVPVVIREAESFLKKKREFVCGKKHNRALFFLTTQLHREIFSRKKSPADGRRFLFHSEQNASFRSSLDIFSSSIGESGFKK